MKIDHSSQTLIEMALAQANLLEQQGHLLFAQARDLQKWAQRIFEDAKQEAAKKNKECEHCDSAGRCTHTCGETP